VKCTSCSLTCDSTASCTCTNSNCTP
jgi:hypothetical protein